jgi:hypothetical protein
MENTIIHKRPSNQIAAVLTIFFIILLFSSCLMSCNTSDGGITKNETVKSQLLIIVAVDKSLSTESFPRPDTSLIRTLCESLGNTGGTVVVYKVGNPTDKAGFRCTLKPIPDVNSDFMMEKQIEQKDEAEKIKEENKCAIVKLLKDVQQFAFKDTLLDMNTDLNGFFGRANVLLNEPQYKYCKRFLFVVSDGIQSINNVDTPCHFSFKSTDFNLCLCGWKTIMPCKMDVMRFESPKGFCEFINKLSISIN